MSLLMINSFKTDPIGAKVYSLTHFKNFIFISLSCNPSKTVLIFLIVYSGFITSPSIIMPTSMVLPKGTITI